MTDTSSNAFDYDTRAVSAADTLSPADRYQELFVAVQMQRVFPDSKTFVDCAPRQHPARILEAYRAQNSQPGFDLRNFVLEHFEVYQRKPIEFVADPDNTLAEHIDRLWPVLTRKPRQHPEFSSLLPLPHDYVVPGGRFTELYYWDSYFTMLGLDESGHCELLRSMADNFAYLIDTYGHVPNGNRSYYLSRSQPPVFALMTDLFEESGVHRASDYLPQLRKEHAFWTDGDDQLRPGESHQVPGGAELVHQPRWGALRHFQQLSHPVRQIVDVLDAQRPRDTLVGAVEVDDDGDVAPFHVLEKQRRAP